MMSNAVSWYLPYDTVTSVVCGVTIYSQYERLSKTSGRILPVIYPTLQLFLNLMLILVYYFADPKPDEAKNNDVDEEDVDNKARIGKCELVERQQC
jgi:hypothetical protein